MIPSESRIVYDKDGKERIIKPGAAHPVKNTREPIITFNKSAS